MNQPVLGVERYLYGEKINVLKHTTDGAIPEHSHEFIEFSYIASGAGAHIISGNKYPLRQGDIYILNTNVNHQLIANKNTPITVYNFVFESSAIDDTLSDSENFVNIAYLYLFHTLNDKKINSDYIRISSLNYPQIGMAFEESFMECENKRNGYKQVVKSNLLKLLILMFRIYIDDTEQIQNKLLYNRLVVNNIISFLNEHYYENIRCEQLAEKVYLNLSYLSRIFKDITGCTLIKYLQDVRINAACKMLETTDMAVAEVSEKVGYSDIKYFYGIFKKTMKKTPGKYREDYRLMNKN